MSWSYSPVGCVPFTINNYRPDINNHTMKVDVSPVDKCFVVFFFCLFSWFWKCWLPTVQSFFFFRKLSVVVVTFFVLFSHFFGGGGSGGSWGVVGGSWWVYDSRKIDLCVFLLFGFILFRFVLFSNLYAFFFFLLLL